MWHTFNFVHELNTKTAQNIEPIITELTQCCQHLRSGLPRSREPAVSHSCGWSQCWGRCHQRGKWPSWVERPHVPSLSPVKCSLEVSQSPHFLKTLCPLWLRGHTLWSELATHTAMNLHSRSTLLGALVYLLIHAIFQSDCAIKWQEQSTYLVRCLNWDLIKPEKFLIQKPNRKSSSVMMVAYNMEQQTAYNMGYCYFSQI